MRLEIILRYLGYILLLNSLFLFLSAAISALGAEEAAYPLAFCAIVTLLFGTFPFLFVSATNEITDHEGLCIVVLGWLLSCLVGMLPYFLWGGPFYLTNAWFESVSGFTTTGSSILSNIEALPSGILFWRACTHWIGGVGIIVFVLSVIPSLGSASMVLFKSEVSSMAMENFHDRTRKTLQVILGIYVGMTVLETLVLTIQGMNLFDAVTHSFATIATGGFSTKSTSIGYFQSVGIESTVMVFMLLSGMHFGLIFLAVKGQPTSLFKSPITRYYLLALAGGILAVTVNVHLGNSLEWGNALRYASFQVISIGTSTGFATANSALWPAFSQLILIFFTFQCACAGSTSGGIKADRIVIFWKAFKSKLFRLKHPHAVVSVKLGGDSVSEDLISSVLIFILVYFGIWFASSLLITLCGVDLMSAMSSAAACMGNVGPGFGSVGSLDNYSHLPILAKWILTADMLLGRLEIFGLVLFIRMFRLTGLQTT